MKKHTLLSLLTVAVLSLAITVHAQTIKVITLKDGSMLKGKVLGLKDGIYTLETSNLGKVSIPETDILSIAAPAAPGSVYQESTSGNSSQKAQLMNQVEQLQGSIMTDPGLMSEIQNLINDEEIQAILSDPKLMNDVMSYDPEKIQQNDSIQNLMQNPKMLNLMNKVQQKMPAQ